MQPLSPRIAILNPCKLSCAGELKQVIQSQNHYRVSIIEDYPLIPADELFSADLIFLVLDCKRIPEQTAVICQRVNCTPVVGVLANGESLEDCEWFRKCLWGVMTVPFSKVDVLLHLKQYMQAPHSEMDPDTRRRLKEHVSLRMMIGESEPVMKVKEKIVQVAKYDVPVLLVGETGTGKELCARLIHFLSLRSGQPLIAVNCGAIPGELFENELFGHQRGAYTDAREDSIGLLGMANGGTLFLDEVEALSPSAQVKLLRFLEDKKYKPLGKSRYVTADVRIISAAKTRLMDMMDTGQFRQDLFYRLNVVRIRLPSLDQRSNDIPSLVEHFVRRYSILYEKKIKGVVPEAMIRLMVSRWPGNIRELENIIQEAVVTSTSGWIEVRDLNLAKIQSAHAPENYSFQSAKKELIADFEETYLKNVLKAFKGNITRAAKFAQKDRRAFCRLLKKYQIDPALYRPSKA